MAIYYADDKIEFDITIRKCKRKSQEQSEKMRPVEEEPYEEYEKHEYKNKNAMEILRMITEYLEIKR